VVTNKYTVSNHRGRRMIIGPEVPHSWPNSPSFAGPQQNCDLQQSSLDVPLLDLNERRGIVSGGKHNRYG
jgi:hypothetical protein